MGILLLVLVAYCIGYGVGTIKANKKAKRILGKFDREE